ncbi:MAG: hypothetical protein ACKO9H_17045 [Planctomycetota bacterium]
MVELTIFSSTGSEPSADVMAKVGVAPGVMIRPSTGISVLCAAASADLPTYLLLTTFQVSMLGMEGIREFLSPRLAAMAPKTSIDVFDFHVPLSHDQPSTLVQSTGRAAGAFWPLAAVMIFDVIKLTGLKSVRLAGTSRRSRVSLISG